MTTKIEDQNMWTLIRALPLDIIRENILPLSYCTQPSFLLEDIRNFIETRETIFDIYYKANVHLLLWEKDADKNWLVSDILNYIKRYKHTDSIFQARKYNRFMKHKQPIRRQFQSFWGFLQPFERTHFVIIRYRTSTRASVSA